MSQLENYRKNIDLIDDSIIKLLAKRLCLVKKIGILKKEKDLPALDQKRWKQVLSSRMAKAKALHLDPKLIKKIYQLIHQAALEIENEA